MPKKRLNIIDFIIILSVFFVIGAAIFRFIHLNTLSDRLEDQHVTYTLSVKDLDAVYADALKATDKLYYLDKNMFCGDIVSVRSSFVKQDVLESDYTVKSHVNPLKVDLTVDVQIVADVSENGLYLGNNTEFDMGESLDFYTTDFQFNGKITGIHW